MTRRRLEKLRIDRIAAVDAPANQHALVTIVKRAPKKQQVAVPDDNDTALAVLMAKRAELKVVLAVLAEQQAASVAKTSGAARAAAERSHLRAAGEIARRKSPEHPFMEGARKLAREKNLRLYEAMSAHRRANPKSFAHFQASGRPPPAIAKAAPSSAVRDFENAVNSFVINKRIGKCEAMAQVRRQAPALFRKYQDAT